MKKEVPPFAIISVITVIVLMVIIGAWKMFGPNTAQAVTHDDVLKVRDRKESKETAGETKGGVQAKSNKEAD